MEPRDWEFDHFGRLHGAAGKPRNFHERATYIHFTLLQGARDGRRTTSVEAREHRYGSFLPATGDMVLSAIAIRELAQYVVERRRANERREAAKV